MLYVEAVTGKLALIRADGSITRLGAGGGGVSVSSATPQPLGTADPGTSPNASRADHVHAMPSASDVGAVPTSRTITAGAGLTGGGDLSANRSLAVVYGSGGVQAWDADLDAVAGLSSTGLVARTGSGSAAARTITAGSAQVTVTDGSGVSGNPTINLAYAENVRGAGVTYPVGLISEGQFVSLVGGTLVGVTLSLGLHVDMEREITQCIAPEIALSDLGVDAP
jgi:hypothetical protein